MTARRNRTHAGPRLRVIGAAVRPDGLTVVRFELRSRRTSLFLHADDIVAEGPGGVRAVGIGLRGGPAGRDRWVYDCTIRLSHAVPDPYALRLRVLALRSGDRVGAEAPDAAEVRGPWIFDVPIRSAAARGHDPSRECHVRRPPRLLRQTVPYYRLPDPPEDEA